MDSVEQEAGEKRVMEHLVKPLERRGLVKPASLTKAQYDEMIRDLCARLAYMSAESLDALEEHAAAQPGGKARDRMPIANDMLDWAGKIQAPVDDGSPLMRKVFAHEIGRRALDGGFAPELLAAIKKHRLWPGTYIVSQAQMSAADSVRRLEDIERRLAAGRDVSDAEAAWRARRREVIARCDGWSRGQGGAE
ncbi:hypothetical protein DL1_11875 [Thioclava dalianensis]|uniref:Uncharacterized protein n=1 Tax=Thioclava dalianensis TaxID=1185766 RepID=A0A074T9D1_9RHOB|nr:hypothetical protein [Thioclava dalianensis]KEP68406.1 hypothetical protein DL1_11875 [Thioclava dalianensis]SFN62318.1 hypothetical protein SAMN05216224_10839 [Thioclava dalianensis]